MRAKLNRKNSGGFLKADAVKAARQKQKYKCHVSCRKQTNSLLHLAAAADIFNTYAF